VGDKRNGPEQGLLDSMARMVILTIELAGDAAVCSRDGVSRALASALVRAKIEAALKREARHMLATQVSSRTARLTLTEPKLDLREAGRNAAAAVVRRHLELSPQVRKLLDESEAALKKFGGIPVGVWINQQRTLVWISASVLAVAGGGALYYLKAASEAKPPAGNGNTIHLGRLDLSADIKDLQTTPRAFDGTLALSGKWDAASVELTLGGTVAGSTATISADGKLVAPLTGPLSAMVAGRLEQSGHVGGDLQERPVPASGGSQIHYTLAAGLKLEKDSLSLELLGLVKDSRPGGALNFRAEQDFRGIKVEAEAGAEAGLGNFAFKGALSASGQAHGVDWKTGVEGEADTSGAYKGMWKLGFRFNGL